MFLALYPYYGFQGLDIALRQPLAQFDKRTAPSSPGASSRVPASP